jgi:hypothetical protein
VFAMSVIQVENQTMNIFKCSPKRRVRKIEKGQNRNTKEGKIYFIGNKKRLNATARMQKR